ncbi:MAG: hypothetical protein A2Z72_03425 [Omnitrophica bacterium RBG_13_46_9]|nr:MAG: hypothetical protein A2Z72_03425 [Omnitrophica bacterium RBG_13_46_9]
MGRTVPISLVLLFLFLLNLFAGLFFINEGLFHHDSVLLAKAVEDTYATGQLQPEARGRYGAVIVNNIIHFPFFLLGHNADFTTRFSSVLFHSLSICTLFLFAYELLGSIMTAFFSGILLSFTPFYFSPNTWGKEHGLYITFILLSFYFLYRGTDKNNILSVGLSSFLAAFSVSIKESALAVLPLYFLLYLRPKFTTRPFRIVIKKERFDPKTLACLILPMAAVLGVLYFTYLKGEFYREIVLRDNTTALFMGPFSKMLKVAFKDLRIGVPPVIFLFFGLGIIRMFLQKKTFAPLFLLAWLALIFYFGNIETFVLRYLDIVMIPVYIGTAYFLSWLHDKDKVAANAIVLYFTLSMFLVMYPMLKFRHTYNGEKRYALFVRDKTEPNAIIITMDDSAFIEYYADRRTTPHPIDDAGKMIEFMKKIRSYVRKGIPVYVTGSAFSYDHKKTFRKVFDLSFDMESIGSLLAEDYHRPEVQFTKYNEELLKLAPKGDPRSTLE